MVPTPASSGRSRVVLVALCAALAASPGPARAHGISSPVSRQVLFGDGVTLVSGGAFGLFRGDGAGWDWICPEVISRDSAPVFARSGAGTLYATDYDGLRISRDRGCTWSDAPAPVLGELLTGAVADPARPSRVWATSATGLAAASNALFVTDDDGATFRRALEADEFLEGVAVSPDGARIAAIGFPRASEDLAPVLHLSQDGGTAFEGRPVDLDLGDCSPALLVPVAFDPGEPDALYLVAGVSSRCGNPATTPGWVLVRYDLADDRWTTVLTSWTTIAGLAFAPGGALWVSTWGGMLRSDDHRRFERISALPSTQCVAADGGSIVACTWDDRPGLPALARSTDAGATFAGTFRFADTAGPVAACAPETPAAQRCPAAWQDYRASILELPAAPPPPAAPAGEGCAIADPGASALVLLALRRSRR